MDPKKIISFKCPLGFSKNLKSGYTTLKKVDENIKNIRHKWSSKRKMGIYHRRTKKYNKKYQISLRIMRKGYQIV